ncbi:MAG: hypothetical protein KGI29_02030 [Pseudomonadota bacterium]|nr:hypothetical protein [Pseudomonadota bacterium]MDE3037261.1 hypothetical protein [Pseudomonadota bacterium]
MSASSITRFENDRQSAGSFLSSSLRGMGQGASLRRRRPTVNGRPKHLLRPSPSRGGRIIVPAAGRAELWFWAIFPGIITVALTLLVLVSKHLPGLGHIMPVLPLMPVFYWGMLRAREMPYWLVFTLGLVTDAVIGAGLGMSSLLYMLFLGLVRTQRKYIHKEGFVIKWGYFAGLLGVVSLLYWAMLSFYYGLVMPPAPAFFQWLLTVCCYPLLHQGFDRLQDHMQARRWQVLHGG